MLPRAATVDADGAARNAAAHAELVADLRDQLAARGARRRRDAPAQRHVDARQAAAARPRRRAARPGQPVPRALAAGRATACTTARRPAPGSSPASAGSPGRECVIVANDATVKGGTYYPMTVKKHLRAQEVALQNRLPCIYLVDSGGAFLPHAGRGVPRPRALRPDLLQPGDHVAPTASRRSPPCSGSCTAGGAYVPAMSDEAVIVRNQGTIFLGGPPLVKAATGEVVTAEELGGGDLHAQDLRRHRPPRRRRRATRCGSSATSSPRSARAQRRRGRCAPTVDAGRRPDRALRRRARRPAHALRRARGHRPPRRRQRVRRVQGRVRHDAGHRLRPHPRPPGRHRRQQRRAVLRVRARRARTSSSCATSAAIPLLFLQNITGFMVGRDYEAGGIAKHGAKMVTAVACARVPKLTVVIGGSFGAGNYSMCGRAYSPRFLWMWPNARISVMGGEQAASVLATVRRDQLEARGEDVVRRRTRRRSRRRSASSTSARATPTTRPPGSGTTASSTRPTPAPCSAWRCRSSRSAPLEPVAYGVFRM